MALQKIVDSMRDVTVVDAAKITTGAVPTAALSNVDLVEGTKGADIASAGTTVIGTDGGYFDITGTTGISTMTVAAGRVFTLQFDGVVTLTHSANLYLSGAANFTTEANDHMTFISVAANSVRQIGTGLKDGGSPIAAGGWVLIQTQVASNDGAIEFTTGIDTTYDHYAFVLSDVTPSTDNKNLFIRVGDSGGFDTTSGDYDYMSGVAANSGTTWTGLNDGGSGTSIRWGSSMGNATGEGMCGIIYLSHPRGTVYPMLHGNGIIYNASTVVYLSEIVGVRNAIITLDRVQFYMASGNVATGRFTLYGIAHV